MQDEEIIERIKKKDYAGLEELLAVYGDSMLRTIHSVLSQPHEVSERQDVANEVFYEVWQKIAAYQPERSRLITWLLLISRSRAIDQKRKLNKRSLEEKPVDEQELAIEDSPLTKENFLGFIEDLEALDQRIFLLYYFYQGITRNHRRADGLKYLSNLQSSFPWPQTLKRKDDYRWILNS